jgi:hypothetical protein
MVNAMVTPSVGLQHSDTGLFFNRKVIKPVKGGGKSNVPSNNPYESGRKS